MTDQTLNLIYEQLNLLSTTMSGPRMDWADIVLGLGMAIVGAFLSAALALWYSGKNGPHFVIAVGLTTDDYRGTPSPSPSRHVRFAHITVVNSPSRLPLVPRRTAHACHGWVDFLDMEGKQVVPRMPIRWDGVAEPLKPMLIDNGFTLLYDPSLLRSGGFIDIPPDGSATLSPALRLEEPNTAHGWTTESYAHGWEHPAYALSFGHYRVRVTVETENYSEHKEFLLLNPECFAGFDLTKM